MTTETNSTDGQTKLEALQAALAALEAAQDAYDSDDAGPEGPEWAALQAAEAAADEAREVLRASDEARPFELCEEGIWYDTVQASSLEEALQAARDGADRANYNDAGGTLWIDVRVRCELTGEEESDTVQLDADEPECEDGEEHDWQSPVEIVGGIKENPGVWGHGGGVIIHEVCLRCGCKRTTDTWAQRPDTGEQGLHSVSYEPGVYADEVSALRISEARERLRDNGYDVSRASDDTRLILAITDDREGSGDEQLETIRELLGLRYSVEWTGCGNTDSDGETTSDVRIELA